MSTEQPTLVDAVDRRIGIVERRRRQRRQVLAQVGAVYGRRRRSTTAPDRDATTNTCETCGESIPPDIARVFGDNDGNTAVCDECWIPEHGGRYRTVGSALAAHRNDAGRWDSEAIEEISGGDA